MSKRVTRHLNTAAAAILMLLLPAAVLFAQSDVDQMMSTEKNTFGTLPPSMPSAANPITPEKVALGRVLYFDPRISVDGTVSCSRCHLIGLYATDGLPKAIGNSGKLNPRNAPTVFNAADQIAAHWIGNRKSVEDQATQALVGPPSFGIPSYEAAVKAIKAIPGYASLFAAAFPQEADPVTAANFGAAVGAFERTLITPGPLDDFIGGDASALTARQQRGMMTFIGQGCGGCHSSTYLGRGSTTRSSVSQPPTGSTPRAILSTKGATRSPAIRQTSTCSRSRCFAMSP